MIDYIKHYFKHYFKHQCPIVPVLDRITCDFYFKWLFFTIYVAKYLEFEITLLSDTYSLIRFDFHFIYFGISINIAIPEVITVKLNKLTTRI